MTVTTERKRAFGVRITHFWLRFGMVMAVVQPDMLGAVLSNPAAEGHAFRQVLGL